MLWGVLWRDVKVGHHVFSCQSLLLSTIILNDIEQGSHRIEKMATNRFYRDVVCILAGVENQQKIKTALEDMANWGYFQNKKCVISETMNLPTATRAVDSVAAKAVLTASLFKH